MRYTTVIDITEWPSLYRNQNIRLVYLHLALCSGYHDYNRDLIKISIRRLAEATGLTVSAVRHALQQLEDHKLIKRKDSAIYVRKYVSDQPITPRGAAKKAKVGVVIDREPPSNKNPNAISREEYERRKRESNNDKQQTN